MRRWNNQLKTIVLLGSLTALLTAAGGLVGGVVAHGALLLAVAINGFAYFYSDRMVLRMHAAREVDEREAPELHEMVRELASAAGIPKPRVARIDEEQPNAFATGRSPAHAVVAVTRGLERSLERRQVRAVLAHEIAHVRNRDTLVATIAAALAVAIGYLAHFVQMSVLFGGSSRDEESHGSAAGGLLAALAAPLVASLLQLAVSRSREFLADETAAEISGDPLGLATALSRLDAGVAAVPAGAVHPATAGLFIVSPVSGGGVAGLFATHPATAARIERLHALAANRRLRAA